MHTHTLYCDGKNTPEEMILGAIDAGCEVIGISGHSPLEGEEWCMTEAGMTEYISEIIALKSKYAERIEVLLGLEYDMKSECDTAPFDYIIGSVHYVSDIPVDLSADSLKKEIERRYGGDFYAFARDYYENMYELDKKTGCDIVGHFDLLTKFNEGGRLFDESDERYRRYAIDALDYLISRDLIFEINTGAMSRGYRNSPYPSEFLLRRMIDKGGRIMLNSDSHSAKNICFAFDRALEYARYCGARELTVFKNGRFTATQI